MSFLFRWLDGWFVCFFFLFFFFVVVVSFIAFLKAEGKDSNSPF